MGLHLHRRLAARRRRTRSRTTVATLRRQLGETRERLGDHLDLYQIHSATMESGVLDDADVLRGAGALRESGVRIGFSVSGPRQARDECERALGGSARFDEVQATWNLHERSAGRRWRGRTTPG